MWESQFDSLAAFLDATSEDQDAPDEP